MFRQITEENITRFWNCPVTYACTVCSNCAWIIQLSHGCRQLNWKEWQRFNLAFNWDQYYWKGAIWPWWKSPSGKRSRNSILLSKIDMDIDIYPLLQMFMIKNKWVVMLSEGVWFGLIFDTQSYYVTWVSLKHIYHLSSTLECLAYRHGSTYTGKYLYLWELSPWFLLVGDEEPRSPGVPGKHSATEMPC